MHIHVKRYHDPKASGGYVGYIEPADQSWIAFIDLDGWPRFYLHRDETGRILPDDPAERARAQALLAKQPMRISYTTVQRGEAWFAELEQRHVTGHGATEQEAVTSLMNYVAELAARGALVTS